jgi:hypothetical protein
MQKDARRKLLKKVPTRKLLASIRKDLKREIRAAAAASRKPKRT